MSVVKIARSMEMWPRDKDIGLLMVNTLANKPGMNITQLAVDLSSYSTLVFQILETDIKESLAIGTLHLLKCF